MKWIHNEKGDIGVGTLIIFIAIVLVGAVAAVVLIQSTGVLQQKALKVSKDATTQVSSNIDVTAVLGDRARYPSTVLEQDIQSFLVRIRPTVGTTSIDLKTLIITITDATSITNLNYSATCCISGTFGALPVIDADSSFSFDAPVINTGDLVELEFHTPNSNVSLLKPRQTITINLNQELGAASEIEMTAPSSFGNNRYIILYP